MKVLRSTRTKKRYYFSSTEHSRVNHINSIYVRNKSSELHCLPFYAGLFMISGRNTAIMKRIIRIRRLNRYEPILLIRWIPLILLPKNVRHFQVRIIFFV